MNICKCNNCGDLFEDTNPQVDAKDYQIDNKFESLIDHNCPNCGVDDYLVDIMEDKELPIFPSKPEFINIVLTEREHPIAYKKFYDYLIHCGNDHDDVVDQIAKGITMELCYQPFFGLFALESEAVNSIETVSPYSNTVNIIESF